jgi:hypothetical protein
LRRCRHFSGKSGKRAAESGSSRLDPLPLPLNTNDLDHTSSSIWPSALRTHEHYLTRLHLTRVKAVLLHPVRLPGSSSPISPLHDDDQGPVYLSLSRLPALFGSRQSRSLRQHFSESLIRVKEVCAAVRFGENPAGSPRGQIATSKRLVIKAPQRKCPERLRRPAGESAMRWKGGGSFSGASGVADGGPRSILKELCHG